MVTRVTQKGKQSPNGIQNYQKNIVGRPNIPRPEFTMALTIITPRGKRDMKKVKRRIVEKSKEWNGPRMTKGNGQNLFNVSYATKF